MLRLTTAALVTLGLLLAIVPDLSAEPLAGIYVEDFSTMTYCDTVNTTACWDTAYCSLGLHPFRPTWAGSFQTFDEAYGVTICGDYAYVGAYAAGLFVIDISNPDSPSLAGTYNTPDYTNNVAIAGDYAYLADWSSGLRIVDISDPAHPSPVSCYDTGMAIGVAVFGDYAYVVGHGTTAQFSVVDISDPENPALAGTYDTPSSTRYVVIAGDYAYVADTDSGLEVVDISDPCNPAFAGRCYTPGIARGVDINGDYAYIGDDLAGLAIVDISDPTDPWHVCNCPLPSHARRVAACGDYVYVADHDAGLEVVDVSDPANPVVIGVFDTPSHAHGVAVSGGHACVADWASGLQVAYVASAVLPPLVTGCCGTDDAQDVEFCGDHAYVADGTSGLRVVNVTDPGCPVLAGSNDTPGHACGVAVEGNYAYVADGSSGLRIINVAAPAAPESAGACDTPGEARGIIVEGDYAYVADGAYGLYIIDITVPASPAPAGSCDTPGIAGDVAIAGDRTYIADGVCGVQIVDITDPTKPTVGAAFDTPGDARRLCIFGDCVFVADGDSGFQVIDISDPINPAPAGACPISGGASDVTYSGDLAFVAAGDSGLKVIDIGDPTNPVLASGCDMGGPAMGIVVVADHACAACGNGGLKVVEVFQRRFVAEDNAGQSQVVDEAHDCIVRARLCASQADSIRWQISADSGSTWQDISKDDSWHPLAAPGSGLVWRSSHVYAGGWTNPACNHLEIGWLYEFPVIGSVTDIPDDQGGQVALRWRRSGYDFGDAADPIAEYVIYRRAEDGGSGSLKARVRPHPDEGTLTESSPGGLVWYAPDGWDSVMTVQADAGQDYEAIVPTVLDSTITGGMHYTAFQVSARAAVSGSRFGSYPDSGYSVDNLAPGAPENLSMTSPTDLAWDESAAADFDYFTVYGSPVADLDSTAVAIDSTANISMDISGHVYSYYHVTTTDSAGNEGGASSVENTYSGIVEADAKPLACALRRNRPNPFQARTTIAFDLPQAVHVRLQVFDITGRLVRTLTNARYPAGCHSVVWDGKDDTGRPVGPGVYTVVMDAGGLKATQKLLLLK